MRRSHRLFAATALGLALGCALVPPAVLAQTQPPVAPMWVKDGGLNLQPLCEHKIDGTNLAGCTVQWLWDPTTGQFHLAPVGVGTASLTPRFVVAQDPTTIAGSAPGTAGTPSPNVVTVQGATGGTPLPTQRPGATYTETTVSVSAGAWTLAASSSTTRQKLTVGDATGLGCVWTTSPSPVTGEGFPFSLVGTPGSWVFDDPVLFNAIYVKCASAGVVTIGAA